MKSGETKGQALERITQNKYRKHISLEMETLRLIPKRAQNLGKKNRQELEKPREPRICQGLNNETLRLM